MTTRPDFIIIPCVLIEDTKINPIDRMVYGFIYWYSKMKNEKCIVSNDRLAELCNTTARVVQASLDRLEKGRYISRIFTDKTKRTREEIIPLISLNVRPVDGTVRPAHRTRTTLSVSEVRPTDDQNKNNTIRIINKNIAQRAVGFYSAFWKDLYATDFEVTNWGRLGKVLKPLEKLDDWQVATLIWLHFNWYGASGEDKFAHKSLSEAGFPLDWLPRASNLYKAYLINTLNVKWDDEEAVKKFILPELKKIGHAIT